MNPTARFFIKISILVSLSLQVCASEAFGSSGALSNIEDELHALRPARRHLQRRQASEAAPATPKVEPATATTPKVEDAAGSAAKGDAGSKNAKVSKEEELAGKLFEKIIQMGGGLELVTSLGSTTNEIVEHSKKVQGLVPEISTLTNQLMSNVPKKSDALNKSFSSASEASEALTKSLQAIDQKPEDANVIKDNLKSLEKSFHALLSAADNVAIATIPKLSELLQSADKEQAGQQAAGGEKLGVASETNPAEAKAGELKAADSKAPEPKGAEPKGAESKGAESKGAESKGAESKGAEATGAEPKGIEPKGAEPKIEPIVPDVVVPQQ